MTRKPYLLSLIGLFVLSLTACGGPGPVGSSLLASSPVAGLTDHEPNAGEFMFVTERFDATGDPRVRLTEVKIAFSSWNQDELVPTALDQARRAAEQTVASLVVEAGVGEPTPLSGPVAETAEDPDPAGAVLKVAVRGVGLVADAAGPLALATGADGEPRRYRLDFRGAVLTAAFHDRVNGKMLAGAIHTLDQPASSVPDALKSSLTSLAKAWMTLFLHNRVETFRLAAAS